MSRGKLNVNLILRHLALFWVSVVSIGASASQKDQAPVFSYTLFSEPHSLDPQKTNMSTGGYFFSNIFRGLMKIDGKDQLKPEMAESCKRIRSQRIVCELRTNMKWSDGSALKAQDFVSAFQALIDPNNRYPEAEILLSVKNARAIHKGEKPPESLGVKALNDKRLQIDLSEDDEDFEWKLAHPALSPRPTKIPDRDKASELIVNGPYKISEWKVGHKISLTPNLNYTFARNDRPDLAVFFVLDDALALRMFRGGQLSFNRRVLQENVKEVQDHPGFLRVPLSRFDYIGFGPGLKDYPAMRKALLKGAEYDYFAQLFDSKTTAGCPAFDQKFFSPYFCLKFDLKGAKELIKTLPEDVKAKSYVFGFSQLGGFHIEKGVQWFQNQWQKNLGLKIELKSSEQGTYLRQLKQNPPDLFRKGVTLDRPTCLAGLELFKSTHPENYMKFKSTEYDRIIHQLNTKQSEKKKRELCSKAYKILVDEAVILPLGEMYFNVLSDPKFRGWTINSLNILDLTNLHYVRP